MVQVVFKLLGIWLRGIREFEALHCSWLYCVACVLNSSMACALQVRRAPCTCRWPEHCDSQLAPLAPTRAALKRMALEQQQAEQQQAEEQGAVEQGPEEQQAEQQRAVEQRQQQAQPLGAGGGAPGSAGSSVPTPQQQQAGAAHAASTAAPDAGGDRQLAALEAQYVHRVYDAIAPHFASTRFAVWPKVRAFLEGLPRGALVADVGCGNGKYFGVRHDCFVLGSDRSAGEG